MNNRKELIATIEAEYATLCSEEQILVRAKIAEIKANRETVAQPA